MNKEKVLIKLDELYKMYHKTEDEAERKMLKYTIENYRTIYRKLADMPNAEGIEKK